VRLGVIADIHGNELARLLAGCGAEVVLGGHTHHQADRRAGGVRALNPGSAGQPRPAGRANWLLLEDGGHGGGPELTAQFRAVPFDVAAVVRDLQRRRHPNAAFVESVLDGRG
jgi:hypothetical protein